MFLDGNDEFVDRKFKVLLDDAVFFLSEAERTQKDKLDGTPQERLARRWNSYARASLINSALLLECAANILIDIIDLGPVAFNAIDRMRPAEKFAYYLEVKHPAEKMDTKSSWYKEAMELLDYRNKIVHSKPCYGKWEKITDTRYQSKTKETDLLKLPHSLLCVDAFDALSALRVAMQFLNNYFLSLCKYTSDQTHHLLITDWGRDSCGYDRSWFEWIDRWNLPILFILDVPGIRKLEAEAAKHFRQIYDNEQSDTTPNS